MISLRVIPVSSQSERVVVYVSRSKILVQVFQIVLVIRARSDDD